MLFKLFGAILIICASSKIGFDFAACLTKRVEQLQDIKLGLSSILTEISFRGTPLAEALLKGAEIMHSQAKDIFTSASKKLSSISCITAKEAFLTAIEDFEGDTALKKDDFTVLRGFAGLLGTSDLANQTANIEITQKKLDSLTQQAELQRDKYTKLFRSCGVLAGLLITVLFL